MKIQTWLKNSIPTLKEAEIDSARLDCLVLLENTLKKRRDWILAHDDELLSQSQLEELNKSITQRESHIPLAYIIGSKEFYGRSFTVSEDVLIPRPESEDMITLLLSLPLSSYGKNPIILDIGTGSGILAVTAQLEISQAVVVATDISEEALKLAKQNAINLHAPVQFYTADLLDLPDALNPDIVLTNLPYVPNDLITSEEITKEPSLALFSGNDGLTHYAKFWHQVALMPDKPQVIITESLQNQHADLNNLALTAGYTLKNTLNLAQLFALQ